MSLVSIAPATVLASTRRKWSITGWVSQIIDAEATLRNFASLNYDPHHQHLQFSGGNHIIPSPDLRKAPPHISSSQLHRIRWSVEHYQQRRRSCLPISKQAFRLVLDVRCQCYHFPILLALLQWWRARLGCKASQLRPHQVSPRLAWFSRTSLLDLERLF